MILEGGLNSIFVSRNLDALIHSSTFRIERQREGRPALCRSKRAYDWEAVSALTGVAGFWVIVRRTSTKFMAVSTRPDQILIMCMPASVPSSAPALDPALPPGLGARVGPFEDPYPALGRGIRCTAEAEVCTQGTGAHSKKLAVGGRSC